MEPQPRAKSEIEYTNTSSRNVRQTTGTQKGNHEPILNVLQVRYCNVSIWAIDQVESHPISVTSKALYRLYEYGYIVSQAQCEASWAEADDVRPGQADCTQ